MISEEEKLKAYVNVALKWIGANILLIGIYFLLEYIQFNFIVAHFGAKGFQSVMIFLIGLSFCGLEMIENK